MEVKREGNDALSKKKAVEFVGEIKQELKAVEWTSKEELKVYTKAVVISTFIFGLFIYFVDLIMQNFLHLLRYLVSLIG